MNNKDHRVKLPISLAFDAIFFAKIVQLGTFSYFEKVWCDGAGPKLVLLALSKVLGLWSLWFHNKGSSSKCEPQTGEICWNNQTFLKSGGREEGNLKFSCSNEILTKKANKYFWSITAELCKLNTMPPNKLQYRKLIFQEAKKFLEKISKSASLKSYKIRAFYSQMLSFHDVIPK